MIDPKSRPSELSKTQVIPKMARPSETADQAEAILRDIGRAMRRVEGTNKTEKEGLRCVWHQSKLRTELLSWEKMADRTIDRQELCFFGKMVEFRIGKGIRTGTIPNSALSEDQEGPRVSKAELFVPTRDPDALVLDAASRILRECSKRDFYTQHLLREVNETLAKADVKTMRTQVNGLDFFREIETAGKTDPSRGKTRAGGAGRMTAALPIAIVSVCLAIAAVVFWLLWTRG
ncbi:MAG: hypothetical protein IT381_06790 [Deltaproteobacteria bacterium]|nr:hypothetical protein [Deltaproteobacteria bacterium]